MQRVLGILIPLALSTAGCAGGAWLEGPSEADLPLDAPAHPYPTAVRRPAVPDAAPARMQIADDEPAPPIITLDPNPPPHSPTQHNRVEQPQITAPALAVVPPQYRRPAESTPGTSAASPQRAEAAASPAAITPLAQAAGAAEAPLAPIVSASDVKPAAAQPAASASPTGSEASTAEERAAEIERLRASLIDALEVEIRERRLAKPTDDELPRLEQQLRLAYLLAGRMDDAVSAIDALDPPQRDAYQDFMFGLGVWLSPDEARRVPLRSAKVLRSLREATTDLAGSSKLELKHLAFCERVEHFGGYTEFPRNEFSPKQQVLLYVEVENFAAEHRSSAGYETELQGRYTVFDGRGNIVAERELPLDKSICRNYRRDYYLVYPLYMPDAIGPGRYRLELSIEDRKASGKYEGRKFGEGVIEFSIR